MKTDYLWREVLSHWSLADILDRQIHHPTRQFSQVRTTVRHADRSDNLRRFI